MSSPRTSARPDSSFHRQSIEVTGADPIAFLEAVAGEFDAFAGICRRSPEIRTFLGSPAVNRSQRIELVSRIAKNRFSDLLTRFLGVLIDKNRIGQLEEIHAAFSALMDEQAGIIRGTATFARPIEERVVSRMEEELTSKMKKKVSLWVRSDPGILGGVVLQFGDRLIDASLRHKLLQFRKQALEDLSE